MANHIQNRLQIIGNDNEIKQVREFLQSTDQEGKTKIIDFNKIVPMPEELNITSGGEGDLGMKYLLACSKRYDFEGTYKGVKENFSEFSEERQKNCIELGKKYLTNIVNHGFTTWYDWCVENWGTKWNAYGLDDERNKENYNTLFFETAWSPIVDLILKLSLKFPDIKFIYTWADEDSGYNCGEHEIQNGEYLTHDIPAGGSKEAYELYFELHPGCEDYYELVDGNYQYKEEE